MNLLNSIISEGILKKASDIHINITENKTIIKYRKDSILFNMLEVENKARNCLVMLTIHLFVTA